MTILYTEEDLKPKSNQDLTYILAEILLKKQGAPYTINRKVTLSAVERLRGDTFPDAVEIYCGFGSRLDFCNVANDVYPLQFANQIGLYPAAEGETWLASAKSLSLFQSGLSFTDKNPLRALTACLILLLQGVA